VTRSSHLLIAVSTKGNSEAPVTIFKSWSRRENQCNVASRFCTARRSAMVNLPRLKPNPIPPLHPVPEFLAEGELKARYEDMKAVLRVPWMGVVTMSFAHYRAFYDALWQGARPLCASRDFTDACHRLRHSVEEKVSALGPPPLRKRLAQIGYAERELKEIDESIEIFSEGNFPYLLLATLARMLLEGGELHTSHDIGIQTGSASPRSAGKLVLMEYHHADASTRLVFDDVKTALGLPFLNTDYRALLAQLFRACLGGFAAEAPARRIRDVSR
jgi:hypothetical protein